LFACNEDVRAPVSSFATTVTPSRPSLTFSIQPTVTTSDAGAGAAAASTQAATKAIAKHGRGIIGEKITGGALPG
jgi:hypothetical protein